MTVERSGIFAAELTKELGRQVPPRVSQNGLTIRPGAVAMGVINFNHDVVVADDVMKINR
jgi:hypothetical protein